MRRLLFCLLVMVICSGQTCSLPTPGGDSNGAAKSATLTHSGFDFSKDVGGSADVGDVPDADGDVVGWSPAPTVWTDEGGNSVWWRSRANNETTNFTKDMGAVSLASVIAVPTTWDGTTDTSLPSLQVGHVYVVKCLDGYAKFLVKAIDAQAWTVDVDYQYTSGSSF